MAHRPMPKPDPAGRTFPVQRPSLQTIAPDQRTQETGQVVLTVPKDVSKSSRDYWAIIFATLLIAAMVLLGWRVGKILWEESSAVKKQDLSSLQNGTIPKPSLSKATPKSLPTIDPNIGTKATQAKGPIKDSHTSRVASHTEARNTVAAGPVVIRALVGPDGKVQLAQVVRGNKSLSTAALATVRRLTFNPYAPHGTPLEFETEVTVSEAGARGSSDGIQFSIPDENQPQQPLTTPVAIEKPSK